MRNFWIKNLLQKQGICEYWDHTSPIIPAGHADAAAPISPLRNMRPTYWTKDLFKNCLKEKNGVEQVNCAFKIIPEIRNIPKVLTFDKPYLCNRQPRVGFASPKATPLTRATKKLFVREQYYNGTYKLFIKRANKMFNNI